MRKSRQLVIRDVLLHFDLSSQGTTQASTRHVIGGVQPSTLASVAHSIAEDRLLAFSRTSSKQVASSRGC